MLSADRPQEEDKTLASFSSLSTRATNGRLPVPPHKSLRHALGLPPTPTPTTRTAASTSFAQKIIGHRGALYDELENTRESFLRCAELGCHGIELDAFLLNDGNLVVFHGGETPPGDVTNHVI